MRTILICLVLLIFTDKLVNSSPLSDHSLVYRTLRSAQNEDNGNEDDDKAEEDKSDIEDKAKSDENTAEDKKEDDFEDENISESIQVPEVSQEGSKLLIILVDGFRYDYVSRDKALKGFPRIEKSGVKAEYVKPIFPANSYPNWYAIVTGLYGESHGMHQNYMYDRERKDFFLMSPHPNVSHNHWWNKSEPIWITAEKNGVKSALYLWDGCQVRLRGLKPTVCLQYKALYDSNSANNQTRHHIETILDDFSNDKYRLALLYYEFVDHTGHEYGPNSRKTKQAVRDIDDIIYDLQDSIAKRQIDDQLNVIVVSDHGMTLLEDFDVINIDESLDFNDVDVFLKSGSIAEILPEDGKDDEVYQQLRQAEVKGLNVYKKDNIPERFHMKYAKNGLPILITADDGYLINAPYIKSKVYPERESSEPINKGGGHGYDADHVEEMRTIMYGFGPAFKTAYISKPLEMVDHYNLFCHLIQIECNPNNGTLSRINKLLKESESEESSEDSAEDEGGSDDDGDGSAFIELNSVLIYYYILNFSYLIFNL